jgi:hypothetical protein
LSIIFKNNMATESTTELSIISLASDPFGKCEDWHQSMHQYAANELANRYGLGMMHITATQDEWDNFSINRSTDQEGTVTIAPKPAKPIAPQPLAATSTSGTIALHKTASERYEEYVAAEARIKRAIIISLGPDIRKALGNKQVAGTITKSIPEIVEYVKTNYGTRTNADCDSYSKALQELIANDEVQTFLAFTTRFNDYVDRLNAAGQPLAPRDQIRRFKDATYHHGHIAKGFDLYFEQHPQMADQKLADLMQRIQIHLTNVDRTTHSYAANAASGFTQAQVDQAVQDALARAISQSSTGPPIHYAATASAYFTKAQLDQAVQDAVAKALAKPHAAVKQKHYCYVHGYRNHPGNLCTVMLADPITFTREKLQAKNPRQVRGGKP